MLYEHLDWSIVWQWQHGRWEGLVGVHVWIVSMWLNVVYFTLSAGVWFSISWNGFLCLFWEAFLAGRWQASSSQEHCKLCTPKCITSIPWEWCFAYVPQHVYRTPSLICLWEACIRLYCSCVSVCVQFQSLHAYMVVYSKHCSISHVSTDWLVAQVRGLLWVSEPSHSRWVVQVCAKHCTLKKITAGT